LKKSKGGGNFTIGVPSAYVRKEIFLSTVKILVFYLVIIYTGKKFD